MNKNIQELIKQYVIETASDAQGISESSYKTLGYMMRTDREMASVLCDIYEGIERVGVRFRLDLTEDQDN
jgi:hypothetical protein